MNETLEITTLGGLEIRVGGEPVTGFYSRKVEALLVYLACTGRTQSRDVLADLLWDEVTQSRAMGNLRVVLHNLREKLGAYVEITRTTVALNSGNAVWFDVAELEEGLSSPAVAEKVARALSLYHGDFLAGFYVRDCPRFEEWQLVEQERLRRMVVQALSDLVACYLESGAHDQALLKARKLTELDPLLEQAHRQVMSCLAFLGQRGAALAHYEDCRRILDNELGIEPELETTALYEAIEAGELTPTPDSNAPPRHDLPVPDTPFLGREAVLAEIAALLEDPACRLLTLVGPGGSGKTRLALEAAERQMDRFPHGVFFVALAPLNAVDAIVPTVADAIGFDIYSDEREGMTIEPEQQVLDYLRGKRMLLVLDNFEHLLDGAWFVTEINRSAPDAKVLATSRARLNVGGEQRYQVAGMLYPETGAGAVELTTVEHYSAIKLFMQGARRAKLDFELTEGNLSGVVQLCRLVEGMPLAIRLAAGWVDTLSPSAIAQEIANNLDFLETELRDVPARQRSVRATFDHSWRLLSDREREVFQGLSVFRGGFTRDAAQAVVGATLRELKSLVNKSLLQLGASGRYWIHELLRQYGEAQLNSSSGGGADARDQHCVYYASALQRWTVELKGHRQQAALAEMRAERENARAAWDWAIGSRQGARLDQAVEGLCRYYVRRGRFREGEAACRAAVDSLLLLDVAAPTPVSSEHALVLGKVLTWQGDFCHFLGRFEDARNQLGRGLDLLEESALAGMDTRADQAWALFILSGVVSDAREANQFREQSLALYRAAEDEWGTAILTGAAALHALDSSAYDKAQHLAETSLTLRREIGDQWGTANAVTVLGWVALTQAEFEKAERLLREGVAIHKEIGYRGGDSVAGLDFLSWTLTWRGKFHEAHSVAQDAVERCEDTGHRYLSGWSHSLAGEARLHLGHYAEARAHLWKALDLGREHDFRSVIVISTLAALGGVALALEEYPVASKYLQEGEGLLQSTEYWHGKYGGTLILVFSAYAARGLGEPAKARARVQQALRRAIDTKNALSLIHGLPAAALLLADAGESAPEQAERAVELYALVSRYPVVANSRWFEDVAGKRIAAVAATLPPDVVAAAQERGKARDLWETAAELLQELEDMETD